MNEKNITINSLGDELEQVISDRVSNDRSEKTFLQSEIFAIKDKLCKLTEDHEDFQDNVIKILTSIKEQLKK